MKKATPVSSFEECFQSELARIEQGLRRFLPPLTERPERLHEAMRYAVLGSAKRVRPLLTLLVSDLLRGDPEEGLIPACAIELVHSYSLIHDDLPCLDNDETRRGEPTCHKKFGEPLALLAGDALLTLAFQVLSGMKDPGKVQRIVRELSCAAGHEGMAGGQVLELLCEKNDLDLPTLESIHIQKTGQLIKTSCLAGAIAAGATPHEEARIVKFGEYLGFAFQIVDDILDGDGLLRFMSTHEAKEKAVEVIAKAKQELAGFANHHRLTQVADLVLTRSR